MNERMKRIRRWGLLGAAAVGLTTVSAALGISSGVYDVGATDGHTRPVEWALRSTMEASVREHAADVTIPDGVDTRDPALAARAIGHYSAACASCHGAPGRARAPWMVLYPEPANLTDAATVDRWSDAELYWIIKHGIKDTGMIALGPTHQEKDLWAVTAFVRQLPSMTEDEYARQVAELQARRGGGMKP